MRDLCYKIHLCFEGQICSMKRTILSEIRLIKGNVSAPLDKYCKQIARAAPPPWLKKKCENKPPPHYDCNLPVQNCNKNTAPPTKI